MDTMCCVSHDTPKQESEAGECTANVGGDSIETELQLRLDEKGIFIPELYVTV